jgi:hypothetical protein
MRIKVISKRLRKIKVSSPKLNRVDPEIVAKALGAEKVKDQNDLREIHQRYKTW